MCYFYRISYLDSSVKINFLIKKSQKRMLSQTSRKFYRKKQRTFQHTVSKPKVEKALQMLLIRKSKSKVKHHKFFTEQSEEKDKKSFYTYQKEMIKQQIDSLLRGINLKWARLYKFFEKVIRATSVEAFKEQQLEFYSCFLQICKEKIIGEKKQVQLHSQKDRQRKRKQNRIYIENVKLGKQNKILRDQFSNDKKNQRKSSQDFNNLEKNNGQFDEKLYFSQLAKMEKDLSFKTQEVEILKKEVQILKEQQYLLRLEKKDMNERIFQLKTKNETLCSQIVTLKMIQNKSNPASQEESIMMMQKQQILSFHFELDELRKNYAWLLRKYKSVVQKMKKIVINNDSIPKLSPQYHEIFNVELQGFQSIRCGYNEDFIKINEEKQKSQKKKADGTFFYQNFLEQKEAFNNKEAVKKKNSKFKRYLKPTFYCYIEQELKVMGIDRSNYQHNNMDIKIQFLQILRCILDGKYNEFLYTKDLKQIASFPTFVYSWLNSFFINKKKQKIAYGVNDHIPKEIAPTFYTNLLSQKMNSYWEIISFREFFFESLGSDELYYYLQLRYYILKMDMMDHLNSHFEEIYYIEVQKVWELLEKFILVIDSQFKKNLEEFLKRSVTYIKKKNKIDFHYFLRMMLQYYQFRKKRQIDSISKTIQMVSQSKLINISFQNFLKIFDYHFTFLSLTDKIHLYNTCFTFSSGNITIQTILTILNEEKVFIDWIDKIFLGEEVKLQYDKKLEKEYLIIPPEQELYTMEKKFRYFYNSEIWKEVVNLGIEPLLNNFAKSFRLDSFSIHSRLEECFSLCFFISKKLYRSGQATLSETTEALNITLDFLLKFSKFSIRKLEYRKIRELIKYQEASRRIIRFYLKKKSEMDRSLLHYYTNKYMKGEQNNRIDSLRAQFQSLIQEAKQKNKVITYQQID